MKYFVEFILIFIIVYLFYLLFVILRKDKLDNFKNNTSMKYLVTVYKLDIDKLNIKKIANIIGLTNAFIIAFTYIISMLVDGFLKQMLLAVSVFVILDLVIYHIIGSILKRRDKNV